MDTKLPDERRGTVARAARPDIRPAQRPFQLTPEQVTRIEEASGSQAVTRLRMAGLSSLALSMEELAGCAAADDCTAGALAETAVQLDHYAERLRSLQGMMSAASLRIRIALCHHASEGHG